ncbi:hypothetical protein DRQ53_15875 [bacterium]|nr:MAG: hypothetical protein DRQ53_15875 [bacterium]
MVRILVLLLLLPAFANAECTSLIEFEIEDQFKDKHTQQEILGQTTILIWADRDGSEYLELWDEALDEAFGDGEHGVARRGVAHVKGVPRWIPGLKGKIRGHFSRDKSEWTLMDWKGHFAKAYPLQEEQPNLLVFDAGGCLQGQIAGKEPDAELIEAVRAAVMRANSATGNDRAGGGPD